MPHHDFVYDVCNLSGRQVLALPYRVPEAGRHLLWEVNLRYGPSHLACVLLSALDLLGENLNLILGLVTLFGIDPLCVPPFAIEVALFLHHALCLVLY